MDDISVPAGRRLSRNETHDLGMIVKDRVKVLKAHASEQAKVCMADFEKNLAAQYSWEDDDIWKRAAEEANTAIKAAQVAVNKRCEEMGIPKTFAPAIGLTWQNRGENAVASRRSELRRVAKSSIDAMEAAAITKIEQQSLDLRTQIVAMGILSDDARLFLESLAPVTDAMRQLDFHEVEKKLELEHQARFTRQRNLERGY